MSRKVFHHLVTVLTAFCFVLIPFGVMSVLGVWESGSSQAPSSDTGGDPLSPVNPAKIVEAINLLDFEYITFDDEELISNTFNMYTAYKSEIGAVSDEDERITAAVPDIGAFLEAKILMDKKIEQRGLLAGVLDYYEISEESEFAEFRGVTFKLYETALEQVNLLQEEDEISTAVRTAGGYMENMNALLKKLEAADLDRVFMPGGLFVNSVLPAGVSAAGLLRNSTDVGLDAVLYAGSWTVLVSADIEGYGVFEFPIEFTVERAETSLITVGGAPVIIGTQKGMLKDIASDLPARWRFENENEVIAAGVNKYWVIYFPLDSVNYREIRIQIEIEGAVNSNTAAVWILAGVSAAFIAATAVFLIMGSKKKRNNEQEAVSEDFLTL